MFTIVATNKKQYMMKSGHILKLDKLNNAVGDIIQFNNILYYYCDDEKFYFGKPYVYNCRVCAVVCEHGIDKKIRVVKFKRRKNYLRKYGDRKIFTKIKIISIDII